MLEQFADEGVWIYTMPDGSVPLAGTFEGKSRIAEWFRLFGSSVQTTSFQTTRLLVVALGHEDRRIIESGKSYITDWVHVFHLKGGEIVKFVENVNVSSVLASFA